MVLQEIHIDNFKNISEADIRFSDKTNCFLGDNGMGKSNLLDAVYYLSFCKSFSGQPDAMLVRNDATFMMLRGNYLRNGEPEELQFGFQAGHRKKFRRGGKEYKRLSEHIGLFPLVMAAPSDTDLIRGGSEIRRKFIDRIISQTDAGYLHFLIRYNTLLESRNKLLRDAPPDRCFDSGGLIETLDLQMTQAADYISAARRKWFGVFSNIFGKYYCSIAGERSETVALTYNTTVSPENFPLYEQLGARMKRDLVLGYTSAGIHRDDFDMKINGMPLARSASQGQCKTFVVAMRLAQYEFLSEATGLKPLLLLDDIFDKLDAGRVERIINTVSGDDFGQIFITDTNRENLDTIMYARGNVSGADNQSCRLWMVESGKFTLL